MRGGEEPGSSQDSPSHSWHRPGDKKTEDTEKTNRNMIILSSVRVVRAYIECAMINNK